MKKSPVRLLAISCSVAAFAVALGCGSKSNPAAPTPTPVVPVVAPKLETPAPNSPTNGQQLDNVRPTLKVANAAATGATGDVKYRFEISERSDFPADDRFTVVGDDIPQGDGETSWQPTNNLRIKFRYYWRARATADKVSDPTEWTSVESFTTQSKGFFWNGTEMYDPLTDRSTIGARIGGHFVDNQGWQADTDNDGIDYNIPTCASCTMEFDVTNFNEGEGGNRGKDVKWISMGDGATFGDFQAFRDHPWKMHLEQRGDGDGTGMKLIWRNGENGDGEPGDHTQRNDSTVDWHESAVYHFTLTWNPGGFEVWVGETQPDGSVINNRKWFSDGFGGHAYAPPNHRISLGTRSRGETMAGAIWRNISVYVGGRR